MKTSTAIIYNRHINIAVKLIQKHMSRITEKKTNKKKTQTRVVLLNIFFVLIYLKGILLLIHT